MRTVTTRTSAPVKISTTQGTPNPLFGVAMLKIALELKRGPEPLDALVTKVLTRMRLPEDEFRSYLAHNGGLLKLIAKPRGVTP